MRQMPWLPRGPEPVGLSSAGSSLDELGDGEERAPKKLGRAVGAPLSIRPEWMESVKRHIRASFAPTMPQWSLLESKLESMGRPALMSGEQGEARDVVLAGGPVAVKRMH